MIERDAALIYGLLRLANSALHGRPGRIQSPAQAVSMLGLDRVFRWASLLVLSGYDDCPIGYLGFALQRARACEIVAQSRRQPLQLAYLMGLLSTLDSVLNTPLADILLPLPLDGEVKRAILRRDGELGAILDAVLRYESGDFDGSARDDIPVARVHSAFWEAVEYSAAMMTDLKMASPG